MDFFFIDTTPFVNDYFTNPKEHTYDWRGVLPKDKYLNDQLKVINNNYYCILEYILSYLSRCSDMNDTIFKKKYDIYSNGFLKKKKVK